MENDLDKKLYNDYLKGEKEAFNVLYNTYKSKIEYFIFNIVKDYQKAEDLTQETFMYVMQNKMKEDCSFKYYIYLVAKSKAFNYIKVNNRRDEITEKYLENSDKKVEKDVLEAIIKEENQKELLEAIELLEDKYKNALYLVNMEGLSYEETAKILGQSLQNTKSFIHRGKMKLRKILLKKGFDEMNKITKVVVMVVCTGIILSGAAYAANLMIKNFFGGNTSEGVDTAVNHGYVENVKAETIEADGIEFRIDSFLMDDYNFDMNFHVTLDEKYHVKDFTSVWLEDLKIVDEQGNIVFSTGYNQKTSEPEYWNGYSMSATEKGEHELLISLTSPGAVTPFPKSKHLSVSFTRFVDRKGYYEEPINKVYIGDWKFELDVPEEFYKRETIVYKAKNCTEKGIDIKQIKATLSQTAFKISIPEIYTDKVDYELLHTSTPKNISDKIAFQKEYVETSDGKRFETDNRSDGDGGYGLPNEENKIIDYHATFSLTSYDATDKLSVHIFTNKGKEIVIDFEK